MNLNGEMKSYDYQILSDPDDPIKLHKKDVIQFIEDGNVVLSATYSEYLHKNIYYDYRFAFYYFYHQKGFNFLNFYPNDSIKDNLVGTYHSDRIKNDGNQRVHLKSLYDQSSKILQDNLFSYSAPNFKLKDVLLYQGRDGKKTLNLWEGHYVSSYTDVTNSTCFLTIESFTEDGLNGLDYINEKSFKSILYSKVNSFPILYAFKKILYILLEDLFCFLNYKFYNPNSNNLLDLKKLIEDQAEALDIRFKGDFDVLRLKLYELEEALIPEGLHIVGTPPSAQARENYLNVIPGSDNKKERETYDKLLKNDTELPALIKALDGKFIKPVPGGDIIRSPEILPTGRNMHAFDPFRMPTTFAMQEGKNQTAALLSAQDHFPETVAMVLWGSDNIKTDGGSIAQAMNLMGAKPFFDDYGRLSGAELISLQDLGRPRIDVLMTLSGIFRDLLPLQIKMLADASIKAAQALEPSDMNFIRRNTLAIMEKHDFTIEQAALRVFSNAEGAYGSNVNHLVSSALWDQEDEMDDT